MEKQPGRSAAAGCGSGPTLLASPPVTGRRATRSGLAAVFGALLAVGGPLSCSGSPPVDINYGTEAGADFDAPPNTGFNEDGAVDTGVTTATPDAGTTTGDAGVTDQDAGAAD